MLRRFTIYIEQPLQLEIKVDDADFYVVCGSSDDICLECLR